MAGTHSGDITKICLLDLSTLIQEQGGELPGDNYSSDIAKAAATVMARFTTLFPDGYKTHDVVRTQHGFKTVRGRIIASKTRDNGCLIIYTNEQGLDARFLYCRDGYLDACMVKINEKEATDEYTDEVEAEVGRRIIEAVAKC
ncbi:MAG: hypothetical protein PHC51_01570 [bacterium]|nr:hypothetical protein [bacterium]